MSLNTIWFILVTILFTGFFFLEGFDYGVGILLPFLGRTMMSAGRLLIPLDRSGMATKSG